MRVRIDVLNHQFDKVRNHSLDMGGAEHYCFYNESTNRAYCEVHKPNGEKPTFDLSEVLTNEELVEVLAINGFHDGKYYESPGMRGYVIDTRGQRVRVEWLDYHWFRYNNDTLEAKMTLDWVPVRVTRTEEIEEHMGYAHVGDVFITK